MDGQKLEYDGPIVLAILDGVGLRKETFGNAVKLAHTEFLNRAVTDYQTLALAASGVAVGITEGTMGNSEVGHNALGSGQIIKQGIAKIDESFRDGLIWESDAWKQIINRLKQNHKTLHFAGIFSDGKVHSDIAHLKNLIAKAHDEGIEHIRIHLVLDGRDTPPQSSTSYIAELEQFFNSFSDHPDYRIASGGGRMVFVADRYENDWSVVKAGWDAIVHGSAPHEFSSATEALGMFRAGDPKIQDQYIPPFVITENHHPVGKVDDGDAFIYFDFRADRAIEIAQAFTYHDFPYFDRGYLPDVYFAGMTEYNSDTHVPEHRLIEPVKISDTLNTFLGSRHIPQLAIAETVKFGHITYYFNGNSYEKALLEDHFEIPSDTLPFNSRPWMKSAETGDKVIEAIQSKDYKFIRVNFAAGDMVGHFGELEPTIAAIEAIDIQLGRIADAVDKAGGMLLITADHGNAEELVDETGTPKTSHTTNPVPCIFYDNSENEYSLRHFEDAGLSNIAATVATLLGQEDLPDSWRPPLIG